MHNLCALSLFEFVQLVLSMLFEIPLTSTIYTTPSCVRSIHETEVMTRPTTMDYEQL